MKKQRSSEGTIRIKIMQNGEVLSSVDLSKDDLRISYTTVAWHAMMWHLTTGKVLAPKE